MTVLLTSVFGSIIQLEIFTLIYILKPTVEKQHRIVDANKIAKESSSRFSKYNIVEKRKKVLDMFVQRFNRHKNTLKINTISLKLKLNRKTKHLKSKQLNYSH